MEQLQNSERERASKALETIIPILEKCGFKDQWCITGGFAAYAYGVNRPLTDIDIDILTSKDDPAFKSLLDELAPHMTQPLEHFVDQNYDNYNFEVTIEGVVIDICPMAEMQVIDRDTKMPVHFYGPTLPDMEYVEFEGTTLPLLSKKRVVENKKMLVWQRDSDMRDMAALEALMK